MPCLKEQQSHRFFAEDNMKRGVWRGQVACNETVEDIDLPVSLKWLWLWGRRTLCRNHGGGSVGEMLASANIRTFRLKESQHRWHVLHYHLFTHEVVIMGVWIHSLSHCHLSFKSAITVVCIHCFTFMSSKLVRHSILQIDTDSNDSQCT